jgi:hypothetical protein
MIIAPKKILAPCNAAYSVGSSVRAIAVGCLLGGAVSCAMAEPGGQSRGDDQRMQSQSHGEQRMDQRAPRAMDGRLDQSQIDTRAFEVRAEEQRRQIQEQVRSDARSRSGRMTPDERRDLRRQINEAGQDLYATPPRR